MTVYGIIDTFGAKVLPQLREPPHNPAGPIPKTSGASPSAAPRCQFSRPHVFPLVRKVFTVRTGNAAKFMGRSVNRCWH
jgi:hypothetical protein